MNRSARSSATALLALAIAGCGVVAPPTPTPTPIPTPTVPPTARPSGTPVDPTAALAQIAREVEGIRGLRSEQTIQPTIIDEEHLRAILRKLNAEENPPERIAAQERLYRALGILTGETSLAALTEDLLGEQVAGFYVPERDALYVVSRSGALAAAEKVTFAHEFDHALQDQAFDLEPLTADAETEGDRALARLALIEGDATLVMSYWAQEHLGLLDLIQLLSESFGPGQASLDAVPSFLRDSLLFPYERGLEFVLGIQMQGGWEAVNAAYAAPPDSTEQILHPEKYAAREAALEVEIPANLPSRIGPGWTMTLIDTLGEFQIGAWLAARGAPRAEALSAAAGWGGDRVAVLTGPEGRWLVALVTRWDNDAEAAEFAAAAEAVLPALYPSVLKTQFGARVVFVADNPSTLDNLWGMVLAALSPP